MDHDEFNDFEEASPAQEGMDLPPQEELPEPSPDTLSAQPAAESSLPDTSMQPSYSMMANFPSEQSGGMESQGWEGSVWPSLGKMESDHLAEVEPMGVNFSKRKSEGEIQPQSPDYPHAPELTEVSNEMESNLSNVGTLNSQAIDDFDWGVSPAKEPVEGIQGLPNQPSKKEDEIFVFSAAEQLVPEVQPTVQTKQPTQSVEPTIQQDQFDDFAGTEARKESQEFVQAQVTETAEQAQISKEAESNSEPVVTKDDLGMEVMQQIVEETKEVVYKQEEVLEQCQPVEVEVEPTVQTTFPEETKPQENVQAEEDEDDQFGDFEETVPTDQAEPPVETSSVSEQQPPQIGHIDDKVQINPLKMALGADLGQKQQQLQHFVDSLPDYSFLLAEAFVSM